MDTRTFFSVSLVRIFYENSFVRSINHHTDCLCLGRLRIACYFVAFFSLFQSIIEKGLEKPCLLYTSDAADE